MGSPEDIKKVVRVGRSSEWLPLTGYRTFKGQQILQLTGNNEPARMLWHMNQDPGWKLREEEEDREKLGGSFLLAALKAEPGHRNPSFEREKVMFFPPK